MMIIYTEARKKNTVWCRRRTLDRDLRHPEVLLPNRAELVPSQCASMSRLSSYPPSTAPIPNARWRTASPARPGPHPSGGRPCSEWWCTSLVIILNPWRLRAGPCSVLLPSHFGKQAWLNHLYAAAYARPICFRWAVGDWLPSPLVSMCYQVANCRVW